MINTHLLTVATSSQKRVPGPSLKFITGFHIIGVGDGERRALPPNSGEKSIFGQTL